MIVETSIEVTTQPAVTVEVGTAPGATVEVAPGPGAPGVGVPPGGEPGQVLVKTGDDDYATAWESIHTGGDAEAALAEHIANPTPHKAYDFDMPRLSVILANKLV